MKLAGYLRDVAFNESVDLLLVSMPPRGLPLAAFDMEYNHCPSRLNAKKELFESVGVLYFPMSSDDVDELSSDFVNNMMARSQKLDRLRDVILESQWDLVSSLDAFAKNQGLLVLHEVALDSVLALSAYEGNVTEESTMPQIDEGFLRKTSFDAVVCTPAPNAKPIVAIEFDGHCHKQPKKAEKDRKKDQACAMARLPVIRISSDGYRTMPKASGAVRNISVAKIREEREFVENALRATVEAVAGSVLSSKWYLEQLHYFIKLEAFRIRERDLNQARDIEELADELWQLASGRIQDLEEAHSRELQGLNQELEQYKAIAEHFSDGQEDWREADEALAMAEFPGRAIDLLLDSLTRSVEATVLDTSLHVRPFDFEFRESEEGKLRMEAQCDTDLASEVGWLQGKKRFRGTADTHKACK